MEAVACGARSPVDPLVLASLRRQLSDALGPHVGVACLGVDGDPASVFAVEQGAIGRAVDKRRREFAAGRTAARAAMAALGWPAMGVPVGADRAPIWPEGLVGSIAHSRQVCVAIVGGSTQVRAMGIDVEEDVPLNQALWPTICTPQELAAVGALPEGDRGRQVTRLFCAKEAFYKWQYPQTRRMLEFGDVQVSLVADSTRFCVHPTVPADPSVLTCDREGHFLTFQGWVLAWLVGSPASLVQGAAGAPGSAVRG